MIYSRLPRRGPQEWANALYFKSKFKYTVVAVHWTVASKWGIVRNFILLGLFGFEMFEILWVLELLTGAQYWDSEKTVLQNLPVLNLAPKCWKFLRTFRYFHFYMYVYFHLPMYQTI